MKNKLYIVVLLILTITVMITACSSKESVQEPSTQHAENIIDAIDGTMPTNSSETEKMSVAEKDISEVIKESEEATVVSQKSETTTNKSEITTKKTELTTKKTETTKVAETTTSEAITFVTWDGKTVKPYEVFVDETGTEVYYNNEGRLCCAESLTAKPIVSEYDADCCYKCGDKNCFPTMSGYYCVICEKDIPALTCHAKAHYYASK